MATIYDWPLVLGNHGHTLPYLEKQVASSGATLSGNERVIGTDAGRWRYTLQTRIWSKKFAGDADRLLAWRGFMALVQGRLNLIRVPFFDSSDFIAANGLPASLTAGQIPYSNGKLHSNGMGFAGPGVNGTASVTAAGATTTQLTLPTGVVIQPGQWFSDGDRAYQIQSVALVSGTTYTVQFVPRLRAAFTAGQVVRFTKISCVMRLVDESIQRVPMTPASVLGQIDLDFTEALL